VAAEWADHLIPRLAARPPSRYVLVQTPGGVSFPLRVGLTAVGRLSENDIVVEQRAVSRRHCVLLVHAGGGCEVYDTASLNGIRVNGRRVGHAWLNPGDVLQLCDARFVVACEEEAAGTPDEGRDDAPADPDGWGTGRWSG
jgi:pSer/pThr/pTyr-binding forkhead associated (FHA) protein